VSLFTNVPVDLALNSIDKRSISTKTNIPKEEFVVAVKFVLNSTFFIFNNKFYKQVFGILMGSPLSPIIADIVMQDLEEIAILNLQIHSLFYYRYVDDIVLALPSENIDDTLTIFYSLHTKLQFTMEVGIDNRLNFLETTLIINSQRIIFDTYQKITFSGRFLNFHSNHPLCHKKDIIIDFIDKIFLLSYP